MTDNARQKCGTIAIVGRPNVGKSTLFNQLLKKHLSPVTYKPQTTRYNIKGILTEADCQMVFIDTPGIHKDYITPLNRILNRNAKSVLLDADLILLMASCRKWTGQDQEIYDIVAQGTAPCILILNKVDLLVNKQDLLPLLDGFSKTHNFDAIIPVSALRSSVFENLRSEIVKHLPQQPFLFKDGEVSDRDRKFIIAELVREKIMKYCHDELPYAVHVQVELLREKAKILEVTANIWVNKPSQRVIMIGAGGSNLKLIGTAARKQIQSFVKCQVYLKLQVKVKKSNADGQMLSDIYVR